MPVNAIMKYRPQRGGLDAAMREMVELPPTADALAQHLGVAPEQIKVLKYSGFDERIGWDTHIVLVNGEPAGFTDGPIA